MCYCCVSYFATSEQLRGDLAEETHQHSACQVKLEEKNNGQIHCEQEMQQMTATADGSESCLGMMFHF